MLKAAKQCHSMALILAIFVIFIFINKPITAQPVDKMPESAKVELMGANGKMPTAIFFPDGDGEKPLMLVVHTSGGLYQSEIDYAIRLQKAGFIAVVPDFYTAYNITPRTKRLTWSKYQEAIHEDFVKIIDQVKKMSKVPSNKVFAVGFSNGGYWAAFLAANGDVDAGISYYGAYSEGGLCRGRNGLDNCSIGSVLSDES
ncbi:MAG: dienelactone hydrolase family protein, partial [Pseudomonadota bacterium]|nr:dienelactone hydrolase family protein [Pseudomonadota bacterium]